jgi:zinc and cadmium transporter
MHPESTRIVLAASLGVIAAGGNLLGGYFVVRREWPRHFLRYFLALGAGYMLGVSLLEIIPESIRLT